MFTFVINLLLKIEIFNPYQLKSIDYDSKLVCQLNGKELMIKLSKDKLWSVVLFDRELFSDWEEFTYISHKTFNRKPCSINKLLIANQLITKHLKNDH